MTTVNTIIIRDMEAILELKKGRHDMPGARVLSQLTQVGEISQQKLADRMGIRLQSLVQTLAHLEKSGYIRRERNSLDKREKLVMITPEGKQQLEAHESFSTLSSRILSPLSEEEKEVLSAMLKKVLANAAEWELQKENESI